VASLHTVDGLLTSLAVSRAPLAKQRAAARWAMARPALRALIKPLFPELRQRGLLD
jgi:hypothetical protein